MNPSFKRSKLARLALGTVALAAATLGPELGCGESKGGLMLAVTTDMLAPKDVNVVSVSIQVGPQIKYNFVGRVTPEGEVLLPATLAIVEPDDPNDTIRVRVIAFKETKARVLRDIITTSPRAGRVALLRMPLSFVNDDSATGSLPESNLPPKTASIGVRTLRPMADPFNPFGADVLSKCADPDQTVIDGECTSARIDSSKLPSYSDSLVFPNGDRLAGGCFKPTTCFQGWREAEVDLEACTAPKNGEVTNVTMVTNGTGDCNANGRCFVPLDRSDEEGGWREEGDRVRLPRGVCKKLREGAKLGFAGPVCAQKTPSMPVCTGGGGTAAPPADAGSDAGRALENVRVVQANGVTGVAAFADRLYYASHEGIFAVEGGEGPGVAVNGDPGPAQESWMVTQLGESCLFTRRAEIDISSTHGYLLPARGDSLKPILTENLTGTRMAGSSLGPTRSWFAATDNDLSGGLLTTLNAGPYTTQDGLYPMVPASAVQVAAGDNVWYGGTGQVSYCTPYAGGPVVACASTTTLAAASEPVEGLAAPPENRDHLYVLQPSTITLLKWEGSAVAFTDPVATGDFSGFDDGVNSFVRGIAARGRCAYFATKRGLEYVTNDKSAAGVLGTVPKGVEVLGVAAPSFAGVQHVWYAARGAAQNGGGVYRAPAPAACQ